MQVKKSRKQIGELLKEQGYITEEHIEYALQEQKVTGEYLGEVLGRIGFVTEYEFATTIARQANLPFQNLDEVIPSSDVLRQFNKNLCLTNEFIPLKISGADVTIATSSSELDQINQLIHRQTGLYPKFVVAEKTKLINAVHYYFYFLDNPVEMLIEKELALLKSDIDQVRSVDNLITLILQLAIKYNASDIHIRPMEKTVNLALRVDGVVRSMFSMPIEQKRVISSIKTRAKMDIAEQRLPQDGSFTEIVLNNQYHIRASTIVSPYGENMVLRVLPLERAFLGMEQLGILDKDVDMIKEMVNEPFGIVLLTGPTGSGKTSTLYASLMTINLLEKNVMTVENPIEYRLPLLRQTQVNSKAGYSFVDAIRYFLRHDPDVMLVGEIRDEETAETAFSASETGHLVLSTLHTNSALGAVPRLQTLGIPPFMLADSLIGVLSQRLVRKICSNCKETYAPNKQELLFLNDSNIEHLYRGKGCEICGGSGYKGRTLIYEVLRFDAAMKQQMIAGNEEGGLEAAARKNGFRTIFETGVIKVKSGVTTVEELHRVLGNVGIDD